jgi:hypothetical protein
MSVQLIDAGACQRALALRDLTDAALGPHAMQLLVQETLAALSSRWRCPVVVHRAPPLVSVADNYDALGYPAEGAARDARYTRGLAAPRLLEAAGLPPAEYSGLAMGIGLDRMLMLRKGIDDIRALRSADPRIAGQMLDLAPYRSVSSQPAIERDLSIAVSAGTSPEELGDRVREAVGPRTSSLETVEVLAETPYAELPEPARASRYLARAEKRAVAPRDPRPRANVDVGRGERASR